MVEETEEQEEGPGVVIHEDGGEAGEVETHTQLQTEGKDEAVDMGEKEEEMECESRGADL